MTNVMRVGGVAAGLVFAAIVSLAPELGAHGHEDNLVVSGSVTVDPSVKPVQHATSGIVAEIHRRDGDRVKSGELLARLDDRAIRANLLMSANELDQLLARKARLEAERDGSKEINFPEALRSRAEDVGAIDAMENEHRTFVARTVGRQSEAEIQQLRIQLLEQEIEALQVQEKAKADELTLVDRELAGIRQLRDKNLAPITRLTALERDAIRLIGEQRGLLPVSIVQAKSRIADTQLQILRAERDVVRDIFSELRDTEEKLRDQVRRKAEFEEQLRSADILAPQDGIVLSSALRAAGCAVVPGTNLMFIAPADERPSIEAKVAAASATRLRLGQNARLTMTAEGHGSEVSALLDRISPATAAQTHHGQSYVTLRFVLGPEAQADFSKWPPGTAVNLLLPVSPKKTSLFGLVSASTHDALATRPL